VNRERFKVLLVEKWWLLWLKEGPLSLKSYSYVVGFHDELCVAGFHVGLSDGKVYIVSLSVGLCVGVRLCIETGLEQAPTPWHALTEIVPKVRPAQALTPMQLKESICVNPFVKEQLLSPTQLSFRTIMASDPWQAYGSRQLSVPIDAPFTRSEHE
jgi:hypothetical protein